MYNNGTTSTLVSKWEEFTTLIGIYTNICQSTYQSLNTVDWASE